MRSPPLPEATASIDNAIAGLLREVRIGQSERTVRTYGAALNRFREYLRTLALPPATSPAHDLNVDHALGFVHWLVDEHFEGQAPKATLRTYLAALSRFYDYIVRERLAPIPAEDRQRMQDAYRGFRKGVARRLPRSPGDDIVQRLIATARSVSRKPDDERAELRRLRDIAILESLRSTGMRVGELTTLRREDLDYRSCVARVLGKGGRERLVYFDGAAWTALTRYLEARHDGARGRALYRLPVFARHDKGAGNHVLPLSTNSVRQVCEDCCKLAGIDPPLTPHALRHAFASRVLEATGDLAATQDLLGHASPTTTRIYASVTTKRLREVHTRAFGGLLSDGEPSEAES